jgi:hypothetical protein
VPSLDDWEEGLGEKFTTQRATKVVAGGFPLAAKSTKTCRLRLKANQMKLPNRVCL